MVLSMIARHTQQYHQEISKIKKKKKKGLLLTSPGNYMSHLGPHSEAMSRKCQGEGRSEVLLLLGWKVGA